MEIVLIVFCHSGKWERWGKYFNIQFEDELPFVFQLLRTCCPEGSQPATTICLFGWWSCPVCRSRHECLLLENYRNIHRCRLMTDVSFSWHVIACIEKRRLRWMFEWSAEGNTWYMGWRSFSCLPTEWCWHNLWNYIVESCFVVDIRRKWQDEM